MIKTTTEVIINFRNCAYTLNGENLANLRRSHVSRLAASLGIKGDLSKNQMLTRMIAILDANGAEKDLKDLSCVSG